jgi:hypothetical protein
MMMALAFVAKCQLETVRTARMPVLRWRRRRRRGGREGGRGRESGRGSALLGL